MVLLIHHPVSAASRKIRLLMAEKHMLFVLKEEEPWNLSPQLYKLNAAGELPVFVFDGNVIAGSYAISEFLEEVSPDNRLISGDAKQKAEIRRLTEWFDLKFTKDVSRILINEKIYKRFAKKEEPDSHKLKTAFNNLNFHMEYIDWLSESRNYLAGDVFSLADISAAAALSVIDYLGDVPWEGYKNAKLWYSKIKSRPSFKDILKDNIKGILPSKHYANLDF